MLLTAVRQLNANRCVVTKIKRATFARLHPVTAVLPDGSTITGQSLCSAVLDKNTRLFSEVLRAAAAGAVPHQAGGGHAGGEEEGDVAAET